MIDFFRYRKLSYIASSVFILITILLIFFKGLNLGIDFKGGFNVEVRSDLNNQDLNLIFSQIDSSREVIVKKELSSNVYSVRIESGFGDKLFLDTVKNKISNLSNIEILMSEYIEPTFSKDLIQNSLYALLSSILVIALYVWVRFDWQFAFAGIMALLHDVFLSIGFMSLFNIEFNLTMIAAILLIAGYSINDTIVLFDRLRSLTSKEGVKIDLPVMINNSIYLNLRRTILTSFTTILALTCLVVLAPINLTEMPIVFIFGVLIGTYSSIFLALPTISFLNYESVLKSRDS
ncbi:protein translocase subunit SecF [Alphaproteobacteria bacterium]|nr:protein translocase subunit SecF [Alphaproteobacteria bacterium]